VNSENLSKRIGTAIITWTLISLVLLSGWGWDRLGAFAQSWPRSLLLPVWLGLSIYGAWCDTRTNHSGGKREIRRHRRILWVIFPILLAWFIALPIADRHGVGIVRGQAIRWLGLLLFAVSLLLRIESIRAQGKQFSMHVALQEGHRLSTGGPYRWVRHPAYLSVVGMVLGISLVFGNVFLGLAMTVINAIWLNGRMRDEEMLMFEEFGEEFSRYRERTRKLIPFVY
jgi:protein-S-isoprenylcysteine O-methyltransferase Ste14